MELAQENALVVAVWVRGIERAEQPMVFGSALCEKCAHVAAASGDGTLTLEISTCALDPALLARYKRFMGFGFTVLEVPAQWRDEHRRPQNWEGDLVNRALLQVDKANGTDHDSFIAPYDQNLERAVLAELNKVPFYWTMVLVLKHSLATEPSDNVLLTVLATLKLDARIEGHHELVNRKLDPLASVKITGEGRRYLAGTQTAPAITNQYNNWGQTGAMGTNATGTINYYQQWEAIGKTVDLSAVALQLEELRIDLQKTATTREDHKQLGQIAEAEEHAEKKDGPKVLSILSAVGTTILAAATRIGADEVVKLLEQHWKH